MTYASRSGERWKKRRHPVNKIPALRDVINQVVTLRMKNKWSVYDLAEKAKVSPTYMVQFERGEHVSSVRTLYKIANALGRELIIRLEEKENESTTL